MLDPIYEEPEYADPYGPPPPIWVGWGLAFIASALMWAGMIALVRWFWVVAT